MTKDENPIGRYYSGGAWPRPITERHGCNNSMAKCQEMGLQWQSANQMQLQ